MKNTERKKIAANFLKKLFFMFNCWYSELRKYTKLAQIYISNSI
jgi:hypothetical protein